MTAETAGKGTHWDVAEKGIWAGGCMRSGGVDRLRNEIAKR